MRALRTGLGVLLLLATVPARPASTNPDAAGPFRRIVSTSPGITETLFALGLGERVVGVCRYCHLPAAVLALPKIGSFLKPDAESIVRLSPDLVLIHAAAAGLPERLATVGVRCATVEDTPGLSGLYASIGGIAEAAGVPARGRSLVADIQAQLAAMREGVQNAPHPRVLLIVGRRPGTLSDIVAVGRSAYLGELLEIAGGANVLDESLPAYPHLSLETVIRLKPDLIIDTGDMGDTPEERERNGRANAALWRSHPLVTAAGLKHIRAETSDALVIPGPRVIEAAAWLRRLVQLSLGGAALHPPEPPLAPPK
jgi:iron complex transport system substrate-binding protein